MKTLVKFFDSPIAPVLLSFFAVFVYTSTKVDTFTAGIGSAFFTITVGWIFATPITHFLASILDFD